MNQEILLKTKFNSDLLKANNLEGVFGEWLFYPGMLFGNLQKWWLQKNLPRQEERGKFCQANFFRHRPHEGLDLYLYRDKNGAKYSIDDKIKVPVMYRGKVVKISADFLGKSIYIEHENYKKEGRRLYSIYGHTKPVNGLTSGQVLDAGDIIAYIAGGSSQKTKIPPHLHISIAWIPEIFLLDDLSWEVIGKSKAVSLLDPLKIMDCKFTILS